MHFHTLNMQLTCCSRETPICKKEDPSACNEKECFIQCLWLSWFWRWMMQQQLRADFFSGAHACCHRGLKKCWDRVPNGFHFICVVKYFHPWNKTKIFWVNQHTKNPGTVLNLSQQKPNWQDIHMNLLACPHFSNILTLLQLQNSLFK